MNDRAEPALDEPADLSFDVAGRERTDPFFDLEADDDASERGVAIQPPAESDLRDLADDDPSQLDGGSFREPLDVARNVGLEPIPGLEGAPNAEEKKGDSEDCDAGRNEDPDPKLVRLRAQGARLSLFVAAAGSACRKKNCLT